MTDIQNILILGASGKTGRLLTNLAMEKKFNVTILAKDTSTFNLNDPKLEIVNGDVLNYKDVEMAVQGQDAVFSTLGSDEKKIEILTIGTQNIILAMENQNLKRFISISSLGCGSTKNKMGYFFPLFIRLKGMKYFNEGRAILEKMLFQSQLNFTQIQSGPLTDEDKDSINNLKAFLPECLKKAWFSYPGKISRKQAAAFMMEELINPKWMHKTVGIFI